MYERNKTLTDMEHSRWAFDIQSFYMLKRLYNRTTNPGLRTVILYKLVKLQQKYPTHIKLEEIPHD